MYALERENRGIPTARFAFSSPVIYLDNSATTQIAPEVRDRMLPFFNGEYGNASSIYRLGVTAKVALEEARQQVAAFIGADAREIVFTSGGTEANNSAILGTVFRIVREGRAFDTVTCVSSPAEHHSVLHPIEFVRDLGANVALTSVDRFGAVVETDFTASGADLLSLMLVNNETGARNPIEQVRRRKDSVFHVDAVQALGREKFDVHAMGIDLLSLSAHKIHGPKGIGALYIKSGLKLEPLLHGGAQERNRRAGTESVASAVGFAEAVRLLERDWTETRSHIQTLSNHLRERLREFPQVRLNSPDSSLDIINFSYDDDTLLKLDGETTLNNFDLHGIAVSNGSACTSGSIQPSHVLLACGRGKAVASNSIRVSFSRYNTVNDVERFVEVLDNILNR